MAEQDQSVPKYHYVFLWCAIISVLAAVCGLPATVYTGYIAYQSRHPSSNPTGGPAPMPRATVYDYSFAIVLSCCAVLCVVALIVGTGWLLKKWKAARLPDPSKLVIHYAWYGYGDNKDQYRDVTKIVQARIVNESVEMAASNTSFQDPFPSIAKALTVKYSFGGTTRKILIPENAMLVLPPR